MEENLVVTNSDGTVYIININNVTDTDDAQFQNYTQIDVGADNFLTAAVIVSDFLVISCEDQLYAFDKTTYEKYGDSDNSADSLANVHVMF